MARLGVGRYADSLRRLLDLKGALVAVDELGPELVPALVLESDRPEWSYLRGEQLASGHATATAAVGLRSSVRLQNPASSGVLIVVEEIIVAAFSTTLDLVQLRLNCTTTGSVAAPDRRMRDQRFGDVTPTGQLFTNNTLTFAGTGGSGWGYFERTHLGNGSSWYRWTRPLILAPGTHALAILGADNVMQISTWHWRERALVQAEL